MPPKAKKSSAANSSPKTSVVTKKSSSKKNKKVDRTKHVAPRPLQSNDDDDSSSSSSDSDSDTSSSDDNTVHSVPTITVLPPPTTTTTTLIQQQPPFSGDQRMDKQLKKRKLEIEKAIDKPIATASVAVATASNQSQKKQKRSSNGKKQHTTPPSNITTNATPTVDTENTTQQPLPPPSSQSKAEVKIASPPIDWQDVHDTYRRRLINITNLAALSDIKGDASNQDASKVYQNVVWINLYMGNLCEFVRRYRHEIQLLIDVIDGDGSQNINGAPQLITDTLLDQADRDLLTIQRAVEISQQHQQQFATEKQTTTIVDFTWFYHLCEFERQWPQLQANDVRKNAIESFKKAYEIFNMFVREICAIKGSRWHPTLWFDYLASYKTATTSKIGYGRVCTIDTTNASDAAALLLKPFEAINESATTNRRTMDVWRDVFRNIKFDRSERTRLGGDDIKDQDHQHFVNDQDTRRELAIMEDFVQTSTQNIAIAMSEIWQEAELWHSMLGAEVPFMKNMNRILYTCDGISDNSRFIDIRDRYNAVKSEINRMLAMSMDVAQTYAMWCRALVYERLKANGVRMAVADIARFLSEPQGVLSTLEKMMLEINNEHAALTKECHKIIVTHAAGIKFNTKHPDQHLHASVFDPMASSQKEQLDKSILKWSAQRASGKKTNATDVGGSGDTEQHLINWFAAALHSSFATVADTAAANVTTTRALFITQFTSLTVRFYDTKIYRMITQTVLPMHPLIATLDKIDSRLINLTPIHAVKTQTSDTESGKARIEFLANHGRRTHLIDTLRSNSSQNATTAAINQQQEHDIQALKQRFFFGGESSCQDIIFNSDQRSLTFAFAYSYEHLIHFIHSTSVMGSEYQRDGGVMMIEMRDSHFLVYYKYGLKPITRTDASSPLLSTSSTAAASSIVDCNGDVKLLDLNYYLKTRNIKSVVNSKRILSAYLSASFFPITTWSTSRQPFLFVHSAPTTSGDIAITSANPYILQLGFNSYPYTENYERRYHSSFVQHMMARLFFYVFERVGASSNATSTAVQTESDESSLSSPSRQQHYVTTFDIFEPLKDLGAILQDLYNEFSKPSNAHIIPQHLIVRLGAISDVALNKCYVMADISNTLIHKRTTNKFMFKFIDGDNYEIGRFYQHTPDFSASMMQIIKEQHSNHLKIFVQAVRTSESYTRVVLIHLFAIQPPPPPAPAASAIQPTQPPLIDIVKPIIATTTPTVDVYQLPSATEAIDTLMSEP